MSSYSTVVRLLSENEYVRNANGGQWGGGGGGMR